MKKWLDLFKKYGLNAYKIENNSIQLEGNLVFGGFTIKDNNLIGSLFLIHNKYELLAEYDKYKRQNNYAIER